MTTAPRPASTVVLVRAAAPLEVFLVRRHDRIAFMGGAHVFPGGAIDRADHLDRPDEICDGAAAAVERMRDVSADEAIAFHAGAIRELFEEAGVLLARRDGAMLAIGPDDVARMDAYRRQLAAHAITIDEVARRESLRLALDALAYFAHWVTPEIETRRFDARFFVAAAPEQQPATHDAGETTHGEWMHPADAIARCRNGEIALPPPTWTTLRALSRFADADEAVAWARTRVVPRVQPGFVQRGDTRLVLLPGDPDGPAVPGFEADECRFILEGGRWRPVDPD